MKKLQIKICVILGTEEFNYVGVGYLYSSEGYHTAEFEDGRRVRVPTLNSVVEYSEVEK